MGDPQELDLDDAVEDDTVEASEEVTTFKLNGQQWTCRNRKRVGAYVIDATFTGQMTDLQFILGMLEPDDSRRFAESLPRDDFPFDVDQRNRLTQFLVERLVNRPTVPPASSGGGRRNTKPTSEESSSSQATRRQRSAS